MMRSGVRYEIRGKKMSKFKKVQEKRKQKKQILKEIKQTIKMRPIEVKAREMSQEYNIPYSDALEYVLAEEKKKRRRTQAKKAGEDIFESGKNVYRWVDKWTAGVAKRQEQIMKEQKEREKNQKRPKFQYRF